VESKKNEVPTTLVEASPRTPLKTNVFEKENAVAGGVQQWRQTGPRQIVPN
jgi:hypothetical protein